MAAKPADAPAGACATGSRSARPRCWRTGAMNP